MKMNNITEKLLKEDPIYNKERELGKHWSNFTDKEAKEIFVENYMLSKIKENHLKQINDTYMDMSWNYFINLIEKYGFKKGYEEIFKYNGFNYNRDEKAVIYYHKEKGLIIFATSFNNTTTVNSGKLYGEIKANNNKEDIETIWQNLSTGGCIDEKNIIYETSHDIREGLFYKLNKLESAGTFLPIWTKKNRFLWFVNYVEEDKENFDYKEITKNKILKRPKEMQEIIG